MDTNEIMHISRSNNTCITLLTIYTSLKMVSFTYCDPEKKEPKSSRFIYLEDSFLIFTFRPLALLTGGKISNLITSITRLLR